MSRYKLIAFEPISENEIASYNFEGVENQEKPLNPNEEFLQLTSKIDFKKLNGITLDYTSPDFQCMDEESEPLETLQLNLTEHLKKHIQTTLNETNALIDILQVCKDNVYMNLKKIVKENHEDNVASYVAAKKMGLSASSINLLTSTVRLTKTLSSVKDQHQQNSFYFDLATLRKEWRIKWFQKNLIGDISLQSCGSLFPENGGFQILEMEDEIDKSDGKSENDLQSLKIVLMNNQEGDPILRININKSSIQESREFKSFLELPEAKVCKNQVEKLNRAQNLLFLHEIFSTLCWESRSLNCPVLVKENRLIINIKGLMNLEMDFIILPEKHWFGYNDKPSSELLELRRQNELTINQHNLISDALIIFLRDLLREKHRSNSCAHFSLANPIAGPVQIPNNQRYRGTQFFRSIDFTPAEQSHVVFLLPSLIDAVVFYKARADLLYVIDKISEISNSSIFVRNHIHLTQSMLNCSISLVIGCTTYSSLQHSFTLILSVSKETINLKILSEQIRHNLVYESIDIELLTLFFQTQIWSFKFNVINKLATVKHNWQLIDIKTTSYPKPVKNGCNFEITLLSKNGKWILDFLGKLDSDNYQLCLSHSQMEDTQPVEWKPINLIQLQRRLMKSDLETIDVLFAAMY